MGCGPSKVAVEVSELSTLPVRSADAKMTREETLKHLNHLAKYLAKRGRHIHVVAVDGVIRTLVLQQGNEASDIDVFIDSLVPGDTQLLRKAAQAVARKSRPRIPNDWINNRTSETIAPFIRQQVEKDAVTQGIIVFHAPGLTIYAGPWLYLFGLKLVRIAGYGDEQPRQHEHVEAYDLLKQYLAHYCRDSLTVDEVIIILQHYDIKISPVGLEHAVRAVNDVGSPRLPPPIRDEDFYADDLDCGFEKDGGVFCDSMEK